MFLILIGIICLFIFYVVKLEIDRRKLCDQFRHVHSLKDYPLIGSAAHFLGINTDNLFYKVNEYCTKPIMKVTSAYFTKFFVWDPDVARDIFLNYNLLGRPFEVKFLLMEYGLLSAQYDIWKQFRRPLSTTINQSAVLSLTPLFNQYINELCGSLETLVGAGTFNLADILVKFSTRQLAESLIGVKISQHESEEIFSALNGAGAVAVSRIFNPFYHPDIIYKFSSLRKSMEDARTKYRKCMQVIYNKKNKIQLVKKLFIDKLYEIENPADPLHETKTDHNLKSMIVAGYETTALAIAYTILMLAMHAEVDKKVYEEIQAHYVIGENIDHDTVKKMVYLDMVIKEVLRLFPLVPFTGKRNVVETYVDQIGTIPKDTEIMINIFKMHRSTQYWGPNADKFDPENFTAERTKKRHPNCYIPFASGPRNCIGLHYANLNIRLAVVRMLSEYRFTTQLKFDELRFNYAVVLRLVGGHMVQVHKRVVNGEISK